MTNKGSKKSKKSKKSKRSRKNKKSMLKKGSGPLNMTSRNTLSPVLDIVRDHENTNPINPTSKKNYKALLKMNKSLIINNLITIIDHSEPWSFININTRYSTINSAINNKQFTNLNVKYNLINNNKLTLGFNVTESHFIIIYNGNNNYFDELYRLMDLYNKPSVNNKKILLSEMGFKFKNQDLYYIKLDLDANSLNDDLNQIANNRLLDTTPNIDNEFKLSLTEEDRNFLINDGIDFLNYKLTPATYKIEDLHRDIKENIKNIILKSKFLTELDRL